jgi:hypothetical protein
MYYDCSHRTKSGELQAVWAELEMDAANKGRKLWEANEQQQFYRAVKDVDLWLDEVEKQLASEDLGKVSHNKISLLANYQGLKLP